jgi:hypothetical protein
MEITIFKPSGEIIRTITCPDSMVNLQPQEDEKYIEKTYDSNLYYIDIVSNTPVLKPVSPSPYYDFDYTQKAWVPNTTKALNAIRDKRNTLLAISDWTQMPDVALTTKETWAVYRQGLRDITNQTDPFNIVWPTAPGA